MSTQFTSDSNFGFRLLPLADDGGDFPSGDAGVPAPAVIAWSSDAPLPSAPGGVRRAPVATAPGDGTGDSAASGMFWLDGDSLLCPCPDCRAPMSVRLWLLVADCWRCRTSIELTEEQEREALRLLKLREGAVSPASRSPGRSAPAERSARVSDPAETADRRSPADRETTGQPSGTVGRPATAPGTVGRPATAQPGPATAPGSPATAPPLASAVPLAHGSTPSPAPLASPTPAAAGRLEATYNEPRRRLARHRTPGAWLLRLLKDSPAWLTSLLIHLIVLMILALLTPPREDVPKHIRLNAIVSANWRRPGQEDIAHPADEVRFDLPVPEKVDLQDRRMRETVIRADQEARELRLVDTADPNLPELERLKLEIGNADGSSVAIAARDPRVRVEMIQQEGGTTLTEAAVARGLRWLAQQQQPDGRWRLDGGVRSDSAATSLALLPFLGAGQTHLSGRHKETVARGLRWLVSQQKPDGDLRADSSGNTGMYAHGQGAIVLSEAFLMTGDEVLRQPAQQAIEFIAAAQYADGGWRYEPAQELRGREQRGDTSVVGWQLMAMQSARAAKLPVPPETFELSSHFLDSVQRRDGALYGYQPGHQPTPAMTAEALLCRIYLGWTKSDPPLMEGVRWLLDEHPPAADRPNVYYWYYGTQALHHVGGEEWERWNFLMRDALVNTQEPRGAAAGSWDPRGEHAAAGGRLYMTALAVCTLEVYYRHLPIFRQIDVK